MCETVCREGLDNAFTIEWSWTGMTGQAKMKVYRHGCSGSALRVIREHWRTRTSSEGRGNSV
jgi:hypothetical protein